MRIYTLFLKTFLMLSLSACGQAPSDKKPKDHAVAIAREQFIKDQPKADLKNFDVVIDEHFDKNKSIIYEVTFVPHEVEGKEPMWGGRTDYGMEIHYYVEGSTLRIIKRHFAR